MRIRYGVLGLLVLLSIITYMDRVCVSVAGATIQKDLGISPEGWGWVMGVFYLSYGAFEIPSGALGDRYGQRRVLARIVVWWSAFTALTGLMTNYFLLLATRFLFGAGEAGAYPNAAGCVGRWFPQGERARAQSAIWAASRIGGALTPVVLVSLMAAVGWRGAFILFGVVGLVWAVIWYAWYSDDPATHPSITPQERAEILTDDGTTDRPAHAGAPWGQLLRSRQLWLIMAMYWFYVWGAIFYMTWLSVYLVNGRGADESDLKSYAALPFLLGAAGNLLGGYFSDALTRRYGPGVGRRLLGAGCLAASSMLMAAAASTTEMAAAVVMLAIGFGAMDGMLPAAWALCLDVGGRHAGIVSGAMNSAGQFAGFLCTVLYGYAVTWTGSYDTPLYLIAAMVFVSAVLFLLIDPARPIVCEADSPVDAEERGW
jgi:MFS transporter, ACS family, glucarate transporter